MKRSTQTEQQAPEFRAIYNRSYHSIFESKDNSQVTYYPDSNQLWFYGSMTDDMVFWKYRDVLKPIIKNPQQYAGLELHLYDIQLSSSTSKRIIQLLKKIKGIPDIKMVWHYDMSDADQHGIVYQFSASFNYQIHISPIVKGEVA